MKTVLALLLLSLAFSVYLLARLRHYRKRYKEFRRMAHEIAGNGELNIPHLRLGELVPEVGNDRDPSAQAVNLVVPYAGWGNYSGFSDSEWATLARLARLGGVIALHDLPAGPVKTMLELNAPAGTIILDCSTWPTSHRPSLIILSISGSPEQLLKASREALLAAAPQAVILWHGFQPGILSATLLSTLGELCKTTALAHIHGTSLLGYRVDLTRELL